MKLSEYKETYYTFTAKASDVARTAAFAGIALVWVFKIDAKPIPRLPGDLLLPTGLFTLGIGFDLIHYVAASVIWGLFHRHHEKRLVNRTDDPELEHSPWLLRIINCLFALKLLCVTSGYAFTILFIVRQWIAVSP